MIRLADALNPVDRLGRRRPLIVGSALLACCLAWQAGCSSAFATPGYSNSHTGIAGIASIFMFSWVFSWSFGPGELGGVCSRSRRS